MVQASSNGYLSSYDRPAFYPNSKDQSEPMFESTPITTRQVPKLRCIKRLVDFSVSGPLSIAELRTSNSVENRAEQSEGGTTVQPGPDMLVGRFYTADSSFSNLDLSNHPAASTQTDPVPLVCERCNEANLGQSYHQPGFSFNSRNPNQERPSQHLGWHQPIETFLPEQIEAIPPLGGVTYWAENVNSWHQAAPQSLDCVRPQSLGVRQTSELFSQPFVFSPHSHMQETLDFNSDHDHRLVVAEEQQEYDNQSYQAGGYNFPSYVVGEPGEYASLQGLTVPISTSTLEEYENDDSNIKVVIEESDDSTVEKSAYRSTEGECDGQKSEDYIKPSSGQGMVETTPVEYEPIHSTEVENVVPANVPTHISGRRFLTAKSPLKVAKRQLFAKAREDIKGEDDDKLHFKPVISLPDNIQVVTGEECLEVMFCERAKLYRFDADAGQWKERGVGEMKLLRHPNSGQGRVLMRREQIKKLCANHNIIVGMELKRNVGSDRSWVWYTPADYADGEARPEKLAIKLKSDEIAGKFKEVYDGLKQAVPSDIDPEKKPADDKEGAGCLAGFTREQNVKFSATTKNTSLVESTETNTFQALKEKGTLASSDDSGEQGDQNDSWTENTFSAEENDREEKVEEYLEEDKAKVVDSKSDEQLICEDVDDEGDDLTQEDGENLTSDEKTSSGVESDSVDSWIPEETSYPSHVEERTSLSSKEQGDRDDVWAENTSSAEENYSGEMLEEEFKEDNAKEVVCQSDEQILREDVDKSDDLTRDVQEDDVAIGEGCDKNNNRKPVNAITVDREQIPLLGEEALHNQHEDHANLLSGKRKLYGVKSVVGGWTLAETTYQSYSEERTSLCIEEKGDQPDFGTENTSSAKQNYSKKNVEKDRKEDEAKAIVCRSNKSMLREEVNDNIDDHGEDHNENLTNDEEKSSDSVGSWKPDEPSYQCHLEERTSLTSEEQEDRDHVWTKNTSSAEQNYSGEKVEEEFKEDNANEVVCQSDEQILREDLDKSDDITQDVQEDDVAIGEGCDKNNNRKPVNAITVDREQIPLLGEEALHNQHEDHANLLSGKRKLYGVKSVVDGWTLAETTYQSYSEERTSLCIEEKGDQPDFGTENTSSAKQNYSEKNVEKDRKEDEAKAVVCRSNKSMLREEVNDNIDDHGEDHNENLTNDEEKSSDSVGSWKPDETSYQCHLEERTSLTSEEQEDRDHVWTENTSSAEKNYSGEKVEEEFKEDNAKEVVCQSDEQILREDVDKSDDITQDVQEDDVAIGEGCDKNSNRNPVNSITVDKEQIPLLGEEALHNQHEDHENPMSDKGTLYGVKSEGVGGWLATETTYQSHSEEKTLLRIEEQGDQDDYGTENTSSAEQYCSARTVEDECKEDQVCQSGEQILREDVDVQMDDLTQEDRENLTSTSSPGFGGLSSTVFVSHAAADHNKLTTETYHDGLHLEPVIDLSEKDVNNYSENEEVVRITISVKIAKKGRISVVSQSD